MNNIPAPTTLTKTHSTSTPPKYEKKKTSFFGLFKKDTKKTESSKSIKSSTVVLTPKKKGKEEEKVKKVAQEKKITFSRQIESHTVILKSKRESKLSEKEALEKIKKEINTFTPNSSDEIHLLYRHAGINSIIQHIKTYHKEWISTVVEDTEVSKIFTETQALKENRPRQDFENEGKELLNSLIKAFEVSLSDSKKEIATLQVFRCFEKRIETLFQKDCQKEKDLALKVLISTVLFRILVPEMNERAQLKCSKKEIELVGVWNSINLTQALAMNNLNKIPDLEPTLTDLFKNEE